jgi:hypothetical protein
MWNSLLLIGFFAAHITSRHYLAVLQKILPLAGLANVSLLQTLYDQLPTPLYNCD